MHAVHIKAILGLTITRCVMALVRGLKALFPCPRCLVANEDQWNVLVCSTLQTADSTKKIIERANQEELLTVRETILKSVGLRNTKVPPKSISGVHGLIYFQNAFWKVENSDPHAALSFDQLHTFPSGLFRDHIWKSLQARVTELGREASVEINEVYGFLFFQLC